MTLPLKDLYTHVQSKMERDYGIAPGALYGYREGNFIGEWEEYLFDTPHNYWRLPGVVPAGHSDRLPAAMQKGISSATRLVDILSMSMPTGDFLDKIIAGITALAESGQKVTVRMLFGNTLGATRFDIPGLLERIRNAIKHRPDTLEVYAGIICFKLASWNHAKLIAVDGNWIMTGGHNLWSEVYLGQKEPIFDLTMCYDGPIAESGTLFANALWKFVAKFPRTIHTFCHSLKSPYNGIGNDVPPEQSVQPAPGAGTMPAMWVTAPGWGVFPEPDSSKIIGSSMMLALVKGLEQATHCQMSQQNLASVAMKFVDVVPKHYDVIGPLGGYTDKFITYRIPGAIPDQGHFYNETLIESLADFLLRGSNQELHIVMSPPGAARGYTKDEPRGAIFDIIGNVIRRRQPGISKGDVVKLLNDRIAVRYPAFNDRVTSFPRWKDGDLMGNHAKFWMLDKKLFYVGSENLYPYTGVTALPNVNYALQEYGILAEADETVSKMVRSQYFDLEFEVAEERWAQVSDLRWT